MKVSLISEKGLNPFKNAIVEVALENRKVVTLTHTWIEFEIGEWREFLNIVWKTCAACSRDSRGAWMVKRTSVKVTLNDGRQFDTKVWYNAENQGLYYESLR